MGTQPACSCQIEAEHYTYMLVEMRNKPSKDMPRRKITVCERIRATQHRYQTSTCKRAFPPANAVRCARSMRKLQHTYGQKPHHNNLQPSTKQVTYTSRSVLPQHYPTRRSPQRQAPQVVSSLSFPCAPEKQHHSSPSLVHSIGGRFHSNSRSSYRRYSYSPHGTLGDRCSMLSVR